jgi:hypothetical protein
VHDRTHLAKYFGILAALSQHLAEKTNARGLRCGRQAHPALGLRHVGQQLVARTSIRRRRTTYGGEKKAGGVPVIHD